MTMDGSVTAWFHSLEEGDRDAAERLWERFARRLIDLARQRLGQKARHGSDEEDVVLSAFDSFCRATEAGRFPQLEDRDGLWQLLVTITLRKVHDQVQHAQRQKRGGGAVLREADLAGSQPSLDQIMSVEPSPELAAEMAEQCQRLLGLLDDDELRSIALLKMEGYTNHEIADQLGCARRTVQRRINLIKNQWEAETAS
jgi:RNA polymerase sigma factor (sigma-70 family)